MTASRFGMLAFGTLGACASMVAGLTSLSVQVRAAQLGAVGARSDRTTDVGLVMYSVPADRAGAFEELVARCLRVLKAGGSPERPLESPALRVFRAASAAPGEALFIVLAEPAASGTSYSIERLLEAAGGADAEVVLAEWRRFLGSTTPFATTMRLLDSVTTDDGLRARLEAGLGSVLGQSGAPSPDPDRNRDQLDRLRQPLWSVDEVKYEVVDRSSATWRLRWVATVRSASLLQGLFGTLSVELLDADGGVLASGRPVDVQLERLEQRTFSGELMLAPAIGARVATVKAEVAVRR